MKSDIVSGERDIMTVEKDNKVVFRIDYRGKVYVNDKEYWVGEELRIALCEMVNIVTNKESVWKINKGEQNEIKF